MEARVSDTLPAGDDWWFEPKWDGFRAIAWSGDVRLDSRNRKPLLRYFPELREALCRLPEGTVVDGEVVVLTADRLDFEVLQMRIHPAARRVQALSEQAPARLVAFDLLALQGEDLRAVPFRQRRSRLVELFGRIEEPWHLTPSTTDRDTAMRWFEEFEAAGCDGIVAKSGDAVYREGRREMIKVKRRHSVDCVVAGYRLHKKGDRLGSILLGLYDSSGQLHYVGHCSGFAEQERRKLLAMLEPVRGADPFGSTARRPGAESRWSTGGDLPWVALEPRLVVQVSYDQRAGNRFRHGARIERWRSDKDPAACTIDQLRHARGPGFASIVEK
jgi:ATP-dependent DNA ligase